MMKRKSAHNQQELEKNFLPSTQPLRQTFIATSVSAAWMSRHSKLQQYAVEMLLHWGTQGCIEMELNESEGGSKRRACCNYLYKLFECGKQQQVNYEKCSAIFGKLN